MMESKNLIVIAGPTASGKTTLSIRLAQLLGTVIVSADSRQLYKEMSIGTACPTADELNMAQHYNIHTVSIHDQYNVADFERDTIGLLKTLFETHDNIILTGGSGLFIDAICDGIDFMPDIEPDVRTKVANLYNESGISALQEEVRRLDPEYFATVDQQNPRRLQRALEICYQTGKTFTSFRIHDAAKRDFNIIKTAILWDRQALNSRIDLRVDQMVEQGLLDEARDLYPFRHLNALNTVGYKELFTCFEGKCSLDEAIGQIKLDTRHYAKRQMTWLNKDNRYKWFAFNDFDAMVNYIESQFPNR